MSDFLKPQSPLQHREGAYIYPLTTADQILVEEDGVRLNAKLNNLVYVGEDIQEGGVAPINADTVGGHPASDFFNVKAGFIYPLAGRKIPEGFLLCDGAAYSRQEYAELFAVIGTTYGVGDGSSTFNVPDLRKRTLIGTDNGDYELGNVGGEEYHTLTAEEMPAHNHFTSSVRVTSSDSGYVAMRSAILSNEYESLSQTDVQGQNFPHNNMQPYTVVNYIISTGKGAGVDIASIVRGANTLPLGIEYGGTGATTVEDMKANFDITPNGIGAMSVVKLWENASPISSFTAQTITLPENAENFDFLLVLTHFSAANPYTSISIIPVQVSGAHDNCNQRRLGILSGSNNRLGTRDITQLEGKIATFGAASYNSGTNNDYIIPYIIYGIRGGLK